MIDNNDEELNLENFDVQSVEFEDSTAIITIEQTVVESESYIDRAGELKEFEITHTHTRTVEVTEDGDINLPINAPQEMEVVVQRVDIDWDNTADDCEELVLAVPHSELVKAIETGTELLIDDSEYTLCAVQLVEIENLSPIEKAVGVQPEVLGVKDSVELLDGTTIKLRCTEEQSQQAQLVADGGIPASDGCE